MVRCSLIMKLSPLGSGDSERLTLCYLDLTELLADSESLRSILNERGGLVLARAGSHPPWPARV